MAECYYLLVDDAGENGELFHATDYVRSTWSPAIQHAAPVSALLVRGLQRCAPREDTRLSRVLVDLLGPVPVDGDLWVRSRVERPGTQIELLSAELLARGPAGAPRVVARASGWRLKVLDTTAVCSAREPGLRPLTDVAPRDMAGKWNRNYLHSVQWRWLTESLSPGGGESWLRPEVDLVAGESMTALERLFAVADCANGIGTQLDIRRWTFLNTDLVVHLHRVPDGEWTGIRALTSYGPDGIGTTNGTLFDEHGPVGSIAQSVLVRPLRT